MKYDDFPILNNENYEYLSNLYNQTQPQNKSQLHSQFYNKLSQLEHSTSTLNLNVNTLLRNTLKENKNNTTQILENLRAVLNIQKPPINNIKIFNIFSYLKNLLTCLDLCSQIILLEDKIYYKKFFNNAQKSILKMINNIILSLENSNIILFKHM